MPAPAITPAALGKESPPLFPDPELEQEREAELNDELALKVIDEQEEEEALGAEELDEVQPELVQVLDEVL